MAENLLKIQICRIFRSPLGSCKSKDQTSDVVETTHHHNKNFGHRYQLIKLFSPQPRSPFSFLPSVEEDQTCFTTNRMFNNHHYNFYTLRSPAVDGQKCPPTSPIISPLSTAATTAYNKLMMIHSPKLPIQKKSKKGKALAYRNMNKCNGEVEDDDEKATLFPWRNTSSSSAATTGRRMAAVKDSLAVVKRSSDPYSDFRRSMVDMIVEKQMFGAKDLEKLLQCFLTLNSSHHHKVIIQVFAEIWEALLPK